MTPYYADDWLTVYLGDCRAVLAKLPADSVHCVITSPPYYGLRDYGTAGQIGLEPTPEQYVAELVAVFREVRRVLRPDGTMWLNLGDSYAWSGGERLYGSSDDETGRGPGTRRHDVARTGLKPKDRMMIPARVALALQADGWWLRDEIVWAKPNPMPSSVTDRTTPAHEMVYLLTKRPRYWYDADAVREPIAESSLQRINQPTFDQQTGGPKDYGNGTNGNRSARKGLENFAKGRRTPSGWNVNHDESNLLGRYDQKRDETDEDPNARGLRQAPEPGEPNAFHPLGRNKRSVWTIATQPYPEAHFATFPEALVEPMVLAGCPERTCVECGAGWERVVERREYGRWDDGTSSNGDSTKVSQKLGHTAGSNFYREYEPPTTTGWRPTCSHDAPTVPGVVLDPFAGSGTVGLVAQRHSRRAILVDLSAEYMKQLLLRNAQMPMGLAP